MTFEEAKEHWQKAKEQCQQFDADPTKTEADRDRAYAHWRKVTSQLIKTTKNEHHHQP